MFTKLFVTTALALLLTSNLWAQSGFRGIIPGASTKAQVERILGRALSDVSSTLSEYKANADAEKLYVQYRSGTDLVERIEVLYAESNDRSKVAGLLNLPARPAASQVNTRGKLEEYYSGTQIVLSYASANVEDGVNRVGYYSRELFDSAIAKVPKITANSENGRVSVAPMPPANVIGPPQKGRETTLKSSTGTAQMVTRGDIGDLMPELALLKSLPDDGTPMKTGGMVSDMDLTLGSLAGTFEFTAPEMARQKRVVVEVVGGKLRWSSPAFTDMLVATGNGMQKDADGIVADTIYMFKFANKTGIRLQFFVRNGRVRQVVYFDTAGGGLGSAILGYPKR